MTRNRTLTPDEKRAYRRLAKAAAHLREVEERARREREKGAQADESHP